jgi:DNA recombination protein RmuC
MSDAVGYVLVAATAIAALAVVVSAILTSRRSASGNGLSAEQLSNMLRAESDRQQTSFQEQARSLRQELSDNIRGFQEAMLGRLDADIKKIDERVGGIGTKLDQDIRLMGEEATKNRDTLRQIIEGKLDESALKQATASSELRKEVTGAVSVLQEALLKSAADQRTAQAEQFDAFATRLSLNLAESERRAEEMKQHLKERLVELATSAEARHQGITITLEAKLKELAEANSKAAVAVREELVTSFQQLAETTKATLNGMSELQRERLEGITGALNQVSEKSEKAQEALRQAVEVKLDTLRSENTAKLDEIRKTVDEQLQITLTERITSSFKLVNDQLEQVHRGLGEMQKLADGVGDLKRVLANVKTRGIFGEVQLGSLIEQMFSPDQYLENAQVSANGQERVEFAIKIPGRSGEGSVLIPIDAKCPIDDYERIQQAAEKGDPAALEAATDQLAARIAACAKDVGTKYVNPPVTTEFAILFLPIEGLYAEVLRRRGLVETMFEKYRVVMAGPTTLLAMLNAFRMSIRAVAIQQRSTEVWQILGAVRTEFGKHGLVLDKLQRQLEGSLNTVGALGTRTKAMRRKLQAVDAIGEAKIEEVLGIPAASEEEDSDNGSDALPELAVTTAQ